MNTELPAQAVLTSCSRTKQGLLALFTADGFLFSVDEETFAAFHLAQAIQNSSPLAGGELAALAAKSESAHAKQTALRLVGARRHAAAELYRKLCQKYDDRAAARREADHYRAYDEGDRRGVAHGDERRLAQDVADYGHVGELVEVLEQVGCDEGRRERRHAPGQGALGEERLG